MPSAKRSKATPEMSYACNACGKVFEPQGPTVGLYCSRCEPSTQAEQKRADVLIEALGPEIGALVSDLVQQSEALVGKHWQRLFDGLPDPKIANFVLGGMLIGPALTFAISAGATEDGVIAIVRKLFQEAHADEPKPSGSN